MAYQVLLTDLAIEDLAGLVRYVARDNPTAAMRLGLALINKLKVLRDHPQLGRMLPERGDPALREIVHRPYRIPYRIRELEQRIEILRFWHGARGDIQLSPEPE
jgi:toxin ParE1/3/4